MPMSPSTFSLPDMKAIWAFCSPAAISSKSSLETRTVQSASADAPLVTSPGVFGAVDGHRAIVAEVEYDDFTVDCAFFGNARLHLCGDFVECHGTSLP